jgi:hypothetical protein
MPTSCTPKCSGNHRQQQESSWANVIWRLLFDCASNMVCNNWHEFLAPTVTTKVDDVFGKQHDPERKVFQYEEMSDQLQQKFKRQKR